tara:strand:- start:443 stop:703 length:261 start_codon:yes stop_codon:yes gene_type:complete
MNYHKILKELDRELDIAQCEIENFRMSDADPLTPEKRTKLNDLYNRRDKLDNLHDLIYDKIGGGSGYDYHECEDPHIPSIHEDQWS